MLDPRGEKMRRIHLCPQKLSDADGLATERSHRSLTFKPNSASLACSVASGRSLSFGPEFLPL